MQCFAVSAQVVLSDCGWGGSAKRFGVKFWNGLPAELKFTCYSKQVLKCDYVHVANLTLTGPSTSIEFRERNLELFVK